MPNFVADASVTLAWCFEDEANAWTDELLDRLRDGDRVVVPAHWPTEVTNGLLMGLRRNRIKSGRPELFWDELARLPIDVESPFSCLQAKAVIAVAEQHGLTVYDAAYLELAGRRGMPLATLDAHLLSAAGNAGVQLLKASKP